MEAVQVDPPAREVQQEGKPRKRDREKWKLYKSINLQRNFQKIRPWKLDRERENLDQTRGRGFSCHHGRRMMEADCTAKWE